MSVIEINDKNYEEYSSGVLLIEFGAEFCAPCKALSPIFEDASNEFPNITFGRADVEQAPALAARAGIRGIPAIAAVGSGKILGKKNGAILRDDIISLAKVLSDFQA
ncbi:MAG: thioredoxin family protein [Synergistaceae bacterium]|jgi:thioredoxin 1|nr:thioredoxin family protein [Synergistaceae bacterium]